MTKDNYKKSNFVERIILRNEIYDKFSELKSLNSDISPLYMLSKFYGFNDTEEFRVTYKQYAISNFSVDTLTIYNECLENILNLFYEIPVSDLELGNSWKTIIDQETAISRIKAGQLNALPEKNDKEQTLPSPLKSAMMMFLLDDHKKLCEKFNGLQSKEDVLTSNLESLMTDKAEIKEILNNDNIAFNSSLKQPENKTANIQKGLQTAKKYIQQLNIQIVELKAELHFTKNEIIIYKAKIEQNKQDILKCYTRLAPEPELVIQR